MKYLKLFENFDFEDDEEEDSEFQGFNIDDLVIFKQPYKIKVSRKHPYSDVGVITNFYIKKGVSLVEVRADGGTIIEIEEKYLTDLFNRGDLVQLKDRSFEHPTLKITYGKTYEIINKGNWEHDRIAIIDDEGNKKILPANLFFKVRK